MSELKAAQNDPSIIIDNTPKPPPVMRAVDPVMQQKKENVKSSMIKKALKQKELNADPTKRTFGNR